MTRDKDHNKEMSKQRQKPDQSRMISDLISRDFAKFLVKLKKEDRS